MIPRQVGAGELGEHRRTGVATGYGERGAAAGVDGTAQFVGKEVCGALGWIVVDLDRRFTRTFSHDSIMARFVVPAAGYLCRP